MKSFYLIYKFIAILFLKNVYSSNLNCIPHRKKAEIENFDKVNWDVKEITSLDEIEQKIEEPVTQQPTPITKQPAPITKQPSGFSLTECFCPNHGTKQTDSTTECDCSCSGNNTVTCISCFNNQNNGSCGEQGGATNNIEIQVDAEISSGPSYDWCLDTISVGSCSCDGDCFGCLCSD